MKCIVLLALLTTALWPKPIPDQKAFEAYTQDSTRVAVNLRYGSDQQPQYYTCHVKTPVCKEGLCYLVTIDMYWDLLGNFVKYELPPGEPLTKFDHEAFTEADYDKLNRILADQHSLLGDYRMEDLVDESTERVSEEVDAVTGATRKSVQNAVVEGAVYTAYTLWHLVNGEIAERIPQHTAGLVDETLLKSFLTADNHHYPYYALDHLSDEQYATHMPAILRLIDTGSVFVARYALNKIPNTVYNDSRWQLALVGQFTSADYTTQNQLLQKLTSATLQGRKPQPPGAAARPTKRTAVAGDEYTAAQPSIGPSSGNRGSNDATRPAYQSDLCPAGPTVAATTRRRLTKYYR